MTRIELDNYGNVQWHNNYTLPKQQYLCGVKVRQDISGREGVSGLSMISCEINNWNNHHSPSGTYG